MCAAGCGSPHQHSFPAQLLVLHLRSNLLMLTIWTILALFVTGDLALKFGLRYLFLSPEYLNEVGFWSFFYLGVGYGVFIMNWNWTNYDLLVIDSYMKKRLPLRTKWHPPKVQRGLVFGEDMMRTMPENVTKIWE